MSAITTEAEQLSGVQVYRDSGPRRDAVMLDAILIVWNGRPAVMMAAQRASGPILWTGMTGGGERRIPYDIALEMHRRSQRLRP